MSESTREWYEKIDEFRLSPRVKLALRMYEFGAVDTLKEAAELMNLNQGYLSLIHNSKPGQEFVDSCQKILEEKSLEGVELLDKLGKRAIAIIAGHAENANIPKISLDAAKDLADRSQTYSKVQKHQVESISLTGQDARALAEALVHGRSVHEQYKELASGDINRIDDGSSSSNSDTNNS